MNLFVYFKSLWILQFYYKKMILLSLNLSKLKSTTKNI